LPKGGFPLVRSATETRNHVGMRSLIILLSHKELFLSDWSWKKSWIETLQIQMENYGI